MAVISVFLWQRTQPVPILAEKFSVEKHGEEIQKPVRKVKAQGRKAVFTYTVPTERYGLRCNIPLCGSAANKVVGSFSARGEHYSFDARVSPKELIGRITSLRDRFAHVFSNESFERCIKRWDKENTFLYLDPPYVGAEDVYSDIGEFGVAQHIQLAEILKDSKATWMLSYGDNALVRELYKGFPIREAKVLYSGLGNAGENQHEADELIIANYEPTEAQGELFAPPVD